MAAAALSVSLEAFDKEAWPAALQQFGSYLPSDLAAAKARLVELQASQVRAAEVATGLLVCRCCCRCAWARTHAICQLSPACPTVACSSPVAEAGAPPASLPSAAHALSPDAAAALAPPPHACRQQSSCGPSGAACTSSTRTPSMMPSGRAWCSSFPAPRGHTWGPAAPARRRRRTQPPCWSTERGGVARASAGHPPSTVSSSSSRFCRTQ